MTWTAETSNGCYQSETIRGLIQSIVDCNTDEPDDRSPDINDLYWMTDHGIICQASKQAIRWFDDQCEAAVAEELEEIQSERDHQAYLHSYYYSTR